MSSTSIYTGSSTGGQSRVRYLRCTGWVATLIKRLLGLTGRLRELLLPVADECRVNGRVTRSRAGVTGFFKYQANRFLKNHKSNKNKIQ